MTLQELLDKEAQLGNELLKVRAQIREMRKEIPGSPPTCLDTDDCSSTMLMSCPWRFDCGED